MTYKQIDMEYLEINILRGIINNCNIDEMYRSFLKNLLNSNKKNKELGHNINYGLLENFLNIILKQTYNKPSLQNNHFVEAYVTSILIDFLGEKESLILFLTKQDSAIEMLKSLSYEDKSLLDYLKHELKKAEIYNHLSIEKLAQSKAIVNCCEALSDCKDKLVFKEKGKVYEKKS